MLQECAEVAILIFLVSFLPDSPLVLVSSGQRQPVHWARRKKTGKRRAEFWSIPTLSCLEEERANLQRRDQGWRKGLAQVRSQLLL